METELKAKRLLICEYYPPGKLSNYRIQEISYPAWEQIEAAIRALNHDALPYVWISLSDHEFDQDFLIVMGGANGYHISTNDGIQYCNPAHTGDQIDVWTSDQGAYPIERYVTYDLDLALSLARYYAEKGELDPRAQWEA